MKKLLTLILAASVVLVGCKEPQSVSADSWQNESGLYYTYPLNGQQDVAPQAPLVVAFLKDVPTGSYTLTPASGTLTPNVAPINDGKSVVLAHSEPFATDTTYTLTGPGLPTAGISFHTRPALAGASQDRKLSAYADFEVASVSPDGVNLPFLDFSTIDLTFSQPLDASTVTYGTSVKLEQNGVLVPATVLVSGRKMTIDPTNASGDTSTNHDLLPGVPVTLTLTTAIKNWRGSKSLVAYSKTFTPLDTTPRATMVQTAPAASVSGDCNDPAAIKSQLTGMPINCVPVIAKLLGDTTNSGQKGDVYAQLAFGPHFPEKTPLRIKKSALLKGGALAVNIGGYVNAGYNSGDVTVTFLSDANGYLIPNPYTTDPNAPKLLIMTSDMGFDTADPRANGAFTQNLLHVTMIGTAIADPKTGVLKADAVSVVEPSVLGLEHGYGILSFHMESYPDQTNLPVPSTQPADTRPFAISSWVPGTQARKDASTDATAVPTTLPPVNAGQANGTDINTMNVADMLRPGDPIIINFTKPFDVHSINTKADGNVADDTVILSDASGRLDFTWKQSGTALIIYPTGGLKYSTQAVSGGSVSATQPSTYRISLTSDFKDLAGNSIQPLTTTDLTCSSFGESVCLTFTMPVNADVNSAGNSAGTGGAIAGHSPVITAIYPGFPCYTDPSTLDLVKGEVGTCDMKPADGTTPNGGLSMPIMPMPANRSIHVAFSQVMKADTIRLPGVAPSTDPGTFVVQKCESATSCNSPTPVHGVLKIKARGLTFVPNKPWVDGALYRYTLNSDDLTANANACNADGTAICAVDEVSGTGHPLKTSMLDSSRGYNQGGPAMTIYFTGAPASDNVLQLLQQYPVADVDASFNLDPGEQMPYSDPNLSMADNPRAELNAAKIEVSGTGGIITSATMGCKASDGPCPNASYTFLTGALMADIVGYHANTEIQALVNDGTLKVASIPPELCSGNSPCANVADINKGAILTWIYPTQLVATNLTTYAVAIGFINQATPTGTQVMRIRYTCDANMTAADPDNCFNDSHGRVPGWIIENTAAGAPPQFVITLNVYMDAPNLHKAINLLANNMHNYPLTLNLVGPLTFLPDGRLQISQANTNAIPINIKLGGNTASVNLVMPIGGNKLNYVGAPIEN